MIVIDMASRLSRPRIFRWPNNTVSTTIRHWFISRAAFQMCLKVNNRKIAIQLFVILELGNKYKYIIIRLIGIRRAERRRRSSAMAHHTEDRGSH